LAIDTVYGLSMLNGAWQIGGPLDAVWMLYYMALGLAALHPSMVSLSEPTPPSTRLTRTRLALLAGASLMPRSCWSSGGPGRADRRRRDRRRLGRAVPAHPGPDGWSGERGGLPCCRPSPTSMPRSSRCWLGRDHLRGRPRPQDVTLAFYPGVPREEVGFRIQVTAANTDDEVSELVAALDRLADIVPLRRI
jgi:hypothetical protein